MTILISGDIPLSGTVSVSGSKNAALPLLAAAACVGQHVTLRNLPGSNDVATMIGLLDHAGFDVSPSGTTIQVAPGTRPPGALDEAARIRASYYLVPALLGAHGQARLPWPGGCAIGTRGMDLHFRVYEVFGDRVTEHADGYTITRAPGAVPPPRINLPFRSRGATIAAVLRALVEGRPLIVGTPNLSPETLSVVRALGSCGVDVTVSATELTVDPAPSLRPGRWVVPGDKIEAATLVCGLAITGGSGTIVGVDPGHLGPFLAALCTLGFAPEVGQDQVRLDASQRGAASPLRAVADLDPDGLDADFEPALLVTSLGVEGTHRFGDAINPGRHTNLLGELAQLGARIEELTSTLCELTGPQRLRPGRVHATDIRTGTALVLAALGVAGESRVIDTGQIQRGHTDLVGALTSLGAKIVQEQA
ncbi:hypothetical protein [Nocardiopsis synnemataformans]|uniref:hypothetical protein n=1 Tax=Nocardiopsis synnemataformans TaxID=61305 RepID=UPI003EB7D304